MYVIIKYKLTYFVCLSVPLWESPCVNVPLNVVLYQLTLSFQIAPKIPVCLSGNFDATIAFINFGEDILFFVQKNFICFGAWICGNFAEDLVSLVRRLEASSPRKVATRKKTLEPPILEVCYFCEFQVKKEENCQEEDHIVYFG